MKAPGFWGSLFRSPEWTALVSIFIALFPFPAGSFLSIFEDDTGIQHLLPDLVGSREVSALLGLSALGDQALHFDIGNAGLLLRGPQDIENRIEPRQQIQRRRCVSGAKLTSI